MDSFKLLEKKIEFVQSNKKCIILHGADSCPSCRYMKNALEQKDIPFMYINIKKEREYADASGITEIPLVSFYSNGIKVADHGKFKKQSEFFGWIRECSYIQPQEIDYED